MTAMRGSNRVPVEPLRKAYEASGLKPSVVCRRMGWVRKTPDGVKPAKTSSLKRMLGITAGVSIYEPTGKRYVSRQTTIDRDRAKALCRAIGVDFFEVYDGIVAPQKPRGGSCSECGERLARPVDHGLCGWCLEEREGCVLA
jgi:hypothetical protein